MNNTNNQFVLKAMMTAMKVLVAISILKMVIFSLTKTPPSNAW
jgi:hypothetical protein